MEFTTRSADNQLRHSVVPLYHENEEQVFVVASSANGISTTLHFGRKELVAYRDMLTEALRHLPELLPPDCTCTRDVYGKRQPSDDCDWHNEEHERVFAEESSMQDMLGDEAEM